MIRRPAVSGQFYPGTAASLEKAVKGFVGPCAKNSKAIGAVCPHAGYIYSGPVAGATMSELPPADTFVILGPNHTGFGHPFSIVSQGIWQTPLGEVGIDQALAQEVLKDSPLVKEDHIPHISEHSIEVQLPFLQYLFKKFEFVPMTVAAADILAYSAIGKAVARAIKDLGKNTVIIASSDMTHYESHDFAKEQDAKAIKAILELDAGKLLETVARHDISMCGYGPVAIMLEAALELGAKKARLVKYQTSGDTSGDYSSVVGYAGMIIE